MEHIQHKPMETDLVVKHSRLWDRLGIFTSLACLIHCLILPFMVVTLPLFKNYRLDHFVHFLILPAVISIASISFFTSYLRHKNRGPILLGSVGVATLISSLVFFDHHNDWPMVVSVIGSVLVLASHSWNIYACHCFCDRTCGHSTHEPHDHSATAE